jgi:hypothetical protein
MNLCGDGDFSQRIVDILNEMRSAENGLSSASPDRRLVA